MTAPQPNKPIKPTLLAFHGSGSTGLIHTVQLVRLNRHLKPHFNIECLEAPFPTAAGPGILPIFEGMGPYKSWKSPHEKLTIDGMRRGEASGVMPPEVESLVRSTIIRIRSEGGTIVGLIGFSQGTRVVAGLLKGCEIRRVLGSEHEELDWLDFKFALSVCGSYPPPIIPPAALEILSANSSLSEDEKKALVENKIQISTLHVQGKEDEWAWGGKMLIDGHYDISEGKSTVLELDMGHHYPNIPADTEKIADWVLETWKRISEAKQ